MSTERRKESKINELISDPDKKLSESLNFPTRVIRTIMYDMRLHLPQWVKLVDEWSHCKYSGIRDSLVDRSNAKGNMTKEIVSNESTWNSVMKFLSVIRCVRFKFTMEMHFTWRKPLVSSFEVENIPLPAYEDNVIKDKKGKSLKEEFDDLEKQQSSTL